ncbi:hypothetical protein [Moraxella lacunata]
MILPFGYAIMIEQSALRKVVVYRLPCLPLAFWRVGICCNKSRIG